MDFEPNPNITWETAKKTDLGLEANLWKGALRVEADYFYEKRSNMLLNPNILVPQEYGLSIAQQNVGIMENRGFELTLGTTKRFANGLRFSVDANFTYARNKLLQVFENAATRNDPQRSRTGRRNGQIFGYKSMGLFTTADDVNKDGKIDAADGYTITTNFGTLRPGDIRYKTSMVLLGFLMAKLMLLTRWQLVHHKLQVSFTVSIFLQAGKDLICPGSSRAQPYPITMLMGL